MMWGTSDIFFFILSLIISSNLLIALILISRGFLEKRLHMRQLSFCFKIVILYLTIPLILITGYIFYAVTFSPALPVISDDFSTFTLIRCRTIELSTLFGNAWFFTLPISVWLIGIILFGGIRFFQEKRTIKLLKKCSKPNQDLELMNLQNAIMGELNIRNKISIYTSNAIPTPFVIGFYKAKIFLPQLDFTKQELELILRHELIHCKSNDLFYRRIVHYLCVLFWFNPIIYVMADSFLDINEMACDEKVLEKKSRDIKLRYARLLVNTAERRLLIKGAVSFTGHTDACLIERRIENFMKKSNAVRKMSFLSLLLSMILICPLTAFASTNAILNIQDDISRKIEAENSTQAPAQIIPDYKVQSGISTDSSRAISFRIDPRGSTMIDFNLSGEQRAIAETISLPSGSQVHIWISGDNSSDKFKAGLIDENNKTTYVSAVNGEIEFTFTIQTAGEYSVFVEGASTADIHVTGSVTIKS